MEFPTTLAQLQRWSLWSSQASDDDVDSLVRVRIQNQWLRVMILSFQGYERVHDLNLHDLYWARPDQHKRSFESPRPHVIYDIRHQRRISVELVEECDRNPAKHAIWSDLVTLYKAAVEFDDAPKQSKIMDHMFLRHERLARQTAVATLTDKYPTMDRTSVHRLSEDPVAYALLHRWESVSVEMDEWLHSYIAEHKITRIVRLAASPIFEMCVSDAPIALLEFHRDSCHWTARRVYGGPNYLFLHPAPNNLDADICVWEMDHVA